MLHQTPVYGSFKLHTGFFVDIHLTLILNTGAEHMSNRGCMPHCAGRILKYLHLRLTNPASWGARKTGMI
jgi:hypothetical protein